jgi:hypothetical protein
LAADSWRSLFAGGLVLMLVFSKVKKVIPAPLVSIIVTVSRSHGRR